MSLINQMLKDLEKRAQPAMTSKAALSGLFASHSKFNRNTTLNRMIGFILLLTVLLFLFVLGTHLWGKHAKMQPIAAVSPPSSARPINSFITPPVVITGITLQSQGPLTSIRFLLDKEVFYHLTRDAENNVVLILENTRLIANLPPLNQLSQYIKTIDMQNLPDGNLKMVLTLGPTTELAHIALATAGKLPELQIDLQDRNVAPAPVVASLPVAAPNTSIKVMRQERDIDTQYHQALKLINDKHYSEAITMLSELLNTNPEYSVAREALAKLLFEQGDNDNAQAIIAEGLRLKPHDPSYTMLQARVLMALNHPNDALQLLLESPPRIQSNPDYYAFIAALYQRLGKSTLAVPLYEELLGQQPTNATWWTGLGIALETIGRANQAIEAYQKASSNNLSAELRTYVESRLSALA